MCRELLVGVCVCCVRYSLCEHLHLHNCVLDEHVGVSPPPKLEETEGSLAVPGAVLGIEFL